MYFRDSILISQLDYELSCFVNAFYRFFHSERRIETNILHISIEHDGNH